MDPLSIIASIAGISQAGASLSKTIYELVSSMRGAPKEIADIARGIHDLSLILSELRHVLRDGKALYRRKLLRHIRSASRRIHKIHEEIKRLIDVGSGFGRLKWALRRSASMQLLYQIEGHKNAINMILQTISLAIQIRRVSSVEDTDQVLRRQQAENAVQAALHSIRELSHDDLSTRNINSDVTEEGSDAGRSPERGQDIPTNHLTLWKGAPDDTAEWMYGVIFAPYAETHAEMNDATDVGASMEPIGSEEDTPSSALVACGHGNLPLLRFTHPVQGSKVVEELLGEWTILSEDEIKGSPIRCHIAEPATGSAHQNPQGQDPASEGAESTKLQEETVIFKDTVMFKDAVGRNLAFPIDKVKTWKGVEELIKHAFIHVDVIGPHVQEGHYDLVICGKIVLPQVWDHWIRPGVLVEMRMWPMEARQPALRPRRPMDSPRVFPGGNPPVKSEQPPPQQSEPAMSVGTKLSVEDPASLTRLGAKSPRFDPGGSTLSGNGSTLGENKQQRATEERKRPRKKIG